MKLEKAIQLLQVEYSYPYQPKDKDLHDAIMLGIEALIRIKAHRVDYHVSQSRILPGETKE